MGKDTKIEWTHHTLNFWWGCVKVSPGCDNCYAETLAKRFGHDIWGTGKPRLIIKSAWNKALAWNEEAKRDGVRRRVFCQSMSDFFELFNYNRHGDELNALRSRVLYDLIPATPNLDWLLLTKRIGNVRKMVPFRWDIDFFPRNVWLGISVVNQEEADRDIPKLLHLPVSRRFLSIEPMLEPIDLKREYGYCLACHRDVVEADPCPYCGDPRVRWRNSRLIDVDWVICGGESGSHARPMNPEWARSLRDECKSAEVPFFFKQGSQTPEWGNYKDFDTFPLDLQVREFPEEIL